MRSKKIRTCVFETNSSSTHSICVAKNQTLTFPKQVEFELGEFGWGESTLSCISSKASYLYTGIVYMGHEVEKSLDIIKSVLNDKGVESIFQPESGGYIDHGSDLEDFINDLLSDPDKLLNYLFSDLSFVLTGNDNSDSNVEIDVLYDHIEYYKGN